MSDTLKSKCPFLDTCNVRKWTLVNFNYQFVSNWELDGKAREVVCGVSEEAEGAVVSSKDVTNKQESYALTLWFCGEERRK